MAYSSQVKARIVAGLITGELGWDNVRVDGKKISKATLSAWMKAARGVPAGERGTAKGDVDARAALPRENRTEPPRETEQAQETEPFIDAGETDLKAVRAAIAREEYLRKRRRLEELKVPRRDSKDKAAFDEALQDVLIDSIDMLRSWARICSDPEFVMANPSGVNELGQTVLDRGDKLVSFARGRERAGS